MVMLSPQPSSSGAVNVLAALLEARTGQQIAANRAWRMDVALRPLLAEQGLDTVEQLVTRLLDGSPALADRVVDLLLNQETSFFRDPGIIEAAAAAIIDGIGARPTRARIWSAGCAAGQEALSLAIAFAEAGVAADIIATDVSEGAIARAKAGRYSQFEIQRGLPVRRMMDWFAPAGDEWQARPELLRLVSYRRQNLVADRPPPGPFDAIFCRNVLFYLTPALRRAVLDGFATTLRPGGILTLGAGETVIGVTDRFAPSRRWRGFYELSPAATLRAAG